MTDGAPPRVLLVGGFGGLLGRALRPELVPAFRVRSVHRRPAAAEGPEVEFAAGDAETIRDWRPYLDDVDAVVTLAWYRWAAPARFHRLRDGLLALVAAARERGVERFVHVSVPDAPASLETGLPYLADKRAVDRAVAGSGLSYRILRPTAMFGTGDVLLGVMLRSIRRFPFFPMFGDGAYHLSPIAAADVARAIRLALDGSATGTSDLGGPRRFAYRDLTDRLFALVGKRPRYWRMSPRAGIAFAGLLQRLGSSLLYAYEVEWLVSDRLGLPPYAGLDRPLADVEPYLAGLAARRRGPGRPGR